MKKYIVFILLSLLILNGCSNEKKMSASTAPLQSNPPSTSISSYEEVYSTVLTQYRSIIRSWNSDDDTEGYPNFTKDYENNKFPSPNDTLEYEWYCMLAEGKYPKDSDYGYVLKNIDQDTIPELFWVKDDGTVLAVFTVSENRPTLLGAYWPRNRCVVLDSGDLYIHGSNGASNYEYSIQRLDPNTKTLVVIEKRMRQGNQFFMQADGETLEITEEEFNQSLQQHPYKNGEKWERINPTMIS